MNINSSNETTSIADRLCRPESSVEIQTIKVLVYVIVIMVSLLGNAFIIIVVCKKPLMRTPVNFFVVNMSVADILITVFCMPRMISRAFLGMEWGISGNLGLILCKVVPFAQDLSASVSVLTIIAMAVDRFFAVLYPLKRVITKRVAYGLIAFVWFSAVAVRAPIFYGFYFTYGEEGKTFCFFNSDSQLAFNVYIKFAYVVFYVVPLLVIAVLYSAVIVSLKKRKPVGVDLSSISQQYKDRLKSTRKVMNMLFTVVFVFTLGWGLYFFVPVLFIRYGLKVCKLIFPRFFFSHVTSAINPCIYLLYIENYRRSFREILNPLYKRCVNAISKNT